MGFFDYLKAFFKALISTALLVIAGFIIFAFALSMMFATSVVFPNNSTLQGITMIISFALVLVAAALWFYAYQRYHHSVHIGRAHYEA